MATTDQELKSLNKTVTEAVNILKLYVGNSAQVKAMNEKEREVVDKWLKITDMAEENQKKQRAFTERLRDENGRFIKKQDQQASKFMGMAGSIKGMFGNMTKGIKAGISNMVNGVINHMSNFFQAVKSQFLSLFGEESEWFELMSSIKNAVTGFMGSLISFIWQKTPNWAKKMIKYLHNMYMLQVKEFKMDLAGIGYDPKKKGVGMGGLITALIALLGGSIGAFLGRYFGFISKLPIFNKIGQMFAAIDDIPFLGKLVKAVKFGFKWIGWPLQMLLGVFDFIKGYKESEADTIWGKLKDGLWSAFEGFIEIPVKLLTWAVEKVLEWFGVEFDGKEAADKILGIAEKLFYMVFEGWEMIFGFVKKGIDKIVTVMKGFWNGLIEGLQETLNALGFAKAASRLEGAKVSNPAGDAARQAALDAEKAKANEDRAYKEEMKQMQIEGAKRQKEIQEGTYLSKFMNMFGNNNNNNNGSGGDVKQIPDEMDHVYIGVGAMSTGMDE